MLIALAGCSGLVVQSNLTPTSSLTSFNGLVSIVQLSSVAYNGIFISVTVVTFLQSGTSTTLIFCGNLVNQFPSDTSVTVSFNPGSPFSTVQFVVVV